MAKFALLIGVGNYDYPNAVRPLGSAHQDVAALQRVLLDPELGDFSEAIPLLDPDPYQMQTAIEALFRDRQKEDLLLLYYSGHGFKDDGGNLYFSTRVTQRTPKGELVKASAVPTRFIHEILADSKSKRQVIILDCCYSGAFDLSLQPKECDDLCLWQHLGAEGRIALTSSSSTQYSYELAGTDLSLYTRFLVEGIESGAADKVGDGKISVHDLHEYVSSKVQEAAPTMHPKMITLKDEGFDIILTKAKTLDPQLRYQKEAEKFAYQADISPVGRAVLDTLREQLGLTLEITTKIEEQVLQPHRSRLKNRERYQEVFRLVVEQEYPLIDRTRQELVAFQNILGLQAEEVEAIEHKILTQPASEETGSQEIIAILAHELTQTIESRSPLLVAQPKGSLSREASVIEEVPDLEIAPVPETPEPPRSRWASTLSTGTVLLAAIGLGSLYLQVPANQISQRSLQQVEAAKEERSFSAVLTPKQPISSRLASTKSTPGNCYASGAAEWFNHQVRTTGAEWKAAIAVARQISPASSYYGLAQSDMEQWSAGLGLKAGQQLYQAGNGGSLQLARSLPASPPALKKGQE